MRNERRKESWVGQSKTTKQFCQANGEALSQRRCELSRTGPALVPHVLHHQLGTTLNKFNLPELGGRSREMANRTFIHSAVYSKRWEKCISLVATWRKLQIRSKKFCLREYEVWILLKYPSSSPIAWESTQLQLKWQGILRFGCFSVELDRKIIWRKQSGGKRHPWRKKNWVGNFASPSLRYPHNTVRNDGVGFGIDKIAQWGKI